MFPKHACWGETFSQLKINKEQPSSARVRAGVVGRLGLPFNCLQFSKFMNILLVMLMSRVKLKTKAQATQCHGIMN